MSERIESTSDIEIKVAPNETVVVESFTVTDEFDIEMIYGSGQLVPHGYAIKQVQYTGSMEVQGHKSDLESKMFHTQDGVVVPKVLDALTINHLEDEQGNREVDSYEDILITSKGYEASSGEVVTTSYEFVAMRKADV